MKEQKNLTPEERSDKIIKGFKPIYNYFIEPIRVKGEGSIELRKQMLKVGKILEVPNGSEELQALTDSKSEISRTLEEKRILNPKKGESILYAVPRCEYVEMRLEKKIYHLIPSELIVAIIDEESYEVLSAEEIKAEDEAEAETLAKAVEAVKADNELGEMTKKIKTNTESILKRGATPEEEEEINKINMELGRWEEAVGTQGEATKETLDKVTEALEKLQKKTDEMLNKKS